MISPTKGSTYPSHMSAVSTALVLAVALLGAVSCSPDSRVTGPLKSVQLPGKLRYDSIAPAELKSAARLRSVSGTARVCRRG